MHTIFAPITSSHLGAVSVIRISGTETSQCLKALGIKKEPAHQKISFHKISDPNNSELIDEVLVSFFKSPNSFTGEDVAEISIHASPFILKKVSSILTTQKNVRIAEAGEFSKRAFLNGKIDLVQAEAIPDLIASETESQHKQALKQLQGKLGQIYENWRFKLISISARLEAYIDFPDEDLPQTIIDEVENNVKSLTQEIKSHINDQKVGQKIKDGFNLAIIGAPNVGKSSLINFLSNSEVAIVSEIAGTTRDVVETNLSINGIAVKISDTAGIRETNDLIEKEGVKRAFKKAEEADLKIIVLDSQNPNSFNEFKDLIDEKSIILLNKIDLCEKVPNWLIRLKPITISLTKKINTSNLTKILEKKISSLLPDKSFQENSAFITQERYRTALQNSVAFLEEFSLTKNVELAAEDLRMATRQIGKITGRVDIENILDVIFSSFCIGK